MSDKVILVDTKPISILKKHLKEFGIGIIVVLVAALILDRVETSYVSLIVIVVLNLMLMTRLAYNLVRHNVYIYGCVLEDMMVSINYLKWGREKSCLIPIECFSISEHHVSRNVYSVKIIDSRNSFSLIQGNFGYWNGENGHDFLMLSMLLKRNTKAGFEKDEKLIIKILDKIWQLCNRFRNNNLDAVYFQKTYMNLWKGIVDCNIIFEADIYKLLEEIFADCSKFSGYSTSFEDGKITETELKSRVEGKAQELTASLGDNITNAIFLQQDNPW